LDKFADRLFVGPILTPYVKYYFREFFHACFSESIQEAGLALFAVHPDISHVFWGRGGGITHDVATSHPDSRSE
jgi:hypothetical protein